MSFREVEDVDTAVDGEDDDLLGLFLRHARAECRPRTCGQTR